MRQKRTIGVLSVKSVEGLGSKIQDLFVKYGQ